MSSDDEILITLVAASSGQSESIPFPRSTPISQVLELCQALFGNDNMALFKDGKHLSSSLTLEAANVQNGDVLAVQKKQRRPASAPASAAGAAGGGLDFSSLLQGPASSSGGGGGLNFSNLLSQGPAPTAPVYFDGMGLNECLSYNQNPEAVVTLLQTKEHLFKELNYHNPRLATKLRNKSHADAVRIWREEVVKGSIHSAMQATNKFLKEKEMKERIKKNPNDPEANEYFASKERQSKVQEQYEQMMETYPESLGRVLMLYIHTKINGHEIPAFCDSGAQATIMSEKVARECGLLDYLDTRFEGMAVGVGTGKILGRIHIVQLQIEDYHFPCSVTVMEDPKAGNGTEMPFLLGLDMMKRHQCIMDLEKGVLRFRLDGSRHLETPFLHEKDLDESRGGTRGFDANKANEQFMKMQEKDDDEMES